MNPRIRPAESRDIPAITALLLEDARFRESLHPQLWAVAADAPARIAAALGTIADPMTGPIRHHWMVAERSGAIVAVAHGANLPPPPIIDLGDATAGVLFDDSHFGEDPAIAMALIAAMEEVMRGSGAGLFVAASPAEWTARTRLLGEAGYRPTTFYMAKPAIAATPPVSPVRNAAPADIDGIVQLSALHRAQLQLANPVFWNIHAEADTRFAAWMRMSLDMSDRAMFVCGADAIDGFIIAQPGSPLHLAPAHDLARIGLIDDFYAAAFEPGRQGADMRGPLDLLAAAETMLHASGRSVALAICPARMTAKADLLRQAGYATANLWMVKPGGRA